MSKFCFRFSTLLSTCLGKDRNVVPSAETWGAKYKSMETNETAHIGPAFSFSYTNNTGILTKGWIYLWSRMWGGFKNKVISTIWPNRKQQVLSSRPSHGPCQTVLRWETQNLNQIDHEISRTIFSNTVFNSTLNFWKRRALCQMLSTEVYLTYVVSRATGDRK